MSPYNFWSGLKWGNALQMYPKIILYRKCRVLNVCHLEIDIRIAVLTAIFFPETEKRSLFGGIYVQVSMMYDRLCTLDRTKISDP